MEIKLGEVKEIGKLNTYYISTELKIGGILTTMLLLSSVTLQKKHLKIY